MFCIVFACWLLASWCFFGFVGFPFCVGFIAHLGCFGLVAWFVLQFLLIWCLVYSLGVV